MGAENLLGRTNGEKRQRAEVKEETTLPYEA
jgi:hypothetical protein